MDADARFDEQLAELHRRFDQTASKEDFRELRGDVSRIVLMLEQMVAALQENPRTTALHAEMRAVLRQTTLSHEARLGAVEARLPPS